MHEFTVKNKKQFSYMTSMTSSLIQLKNAWKLFCDGLIMDIEKKYTNYIQRLLLRKMKVMKQINTLYYQHTKYLNNIINKMFTLNNLTLPPQSGLLITRYLDNDRNIDRNSKKNTKSVEPQQETDALPQASTDDNEINGEYPQTHARYNQNNSVHDRENTNSSTPSREL